MSDSAELGFFTQPGELPSGSVSNPELASMAAGTVKGRQVDAGVGEPVDLTGLEQGENLRLNTLVTDASTSGSSSPYTIATDVNWVRFSALTGTYTVNGCDNVESGKIIVWHVEPGVAGSLVLSHNNVALTNLQRFFCPGGVDLILRGGECAVTVQTTNRHRVLCVSKRVDALWVASITSNLAVPFTVYVSCPSGGAAGTADDVTVWNANAPFAMRILDATLRVSTAVGGSAAALRTASGGGGSVVLPDPGTPTQTFSTATTGPHDDVAVATATVAANGSLFLRRSDRSAVGELILTCIRT